MKRIINFVTAIYFLLFPSNVMGQQKVIVNPIFREEVIKISSQIPYALSVYDFVERYYNEVSKLSKFELKQRMDRDDVKILDGNISNILKAGKNTAMYFTFKDNKYSMRLENDSECLLHILFPSSYQLMKGKNLIQLENEFIEDLISFRETNINYQEQDKRQIIKIASGFYKEVGNHYQSELISNDLFYEEQNKTLKLIFCPEHIAESVQNMLVAYYTPCDLNIELTINKYGSEKQIINIPYKKLVQCICNTGCNLYVGISSIGTSSITANVLAVNDILKFNHLINIVIPTTIIGEDKGTVKGDITLYIPMYNLSALFQEYDNKIITDK